MFTDFVLQDANGRLHTGKRLTTYPDPSEACLAGLDELMRRTGIAWQDLARAVHGTTLGSNVVIERKATGAALATTRGFRDVLAIGLQKRYQLYDLQSARTRRARPGPACYARGGDKPTVTDANLLLGYLDPDGFAGGTMRLDVEAARHAIETAIAGPLEMSVEEAAWGIHAMVNLNMELATRVVSIEHGHDPRSLAFVATGGCGPAHAARLARSLGIRRLILPAAAGVASAIGLLGAEVKFDLSRSHPAAFDSLDPAAAEAMFVDMEREAEQVLGRRPAADVREVDLGYAGQGYELTVPFASARDEFEQLYERRYGMASPGEAIEATTWRLTAVLETLTVDVPKVSPSPTLPGSLGRRSAYFPECGGYTDTAVFARTQLTPGQQLDGPIIVEERESTTVLPPGVAAVVDDYQSLFVS